MKTIKFTTRVGCSAGHEWVPKNIPVLVGGLEDTTILPDYFIAPITMSFDLADLDKCPDCGDVARSIHFAATPGEM